MLKRIICAMLCLAALGTCFSASGESERVFVFCNPETSVNVRRTPQMGADVSGYLDFGDWVETDGEKKNGFLHVLGITENGEGWIFAGYVVEDEPIKLENARAYIAASGRVMSYRWVAGKKNGWVSNNAEVKVFALSDEWAVTNRGYIRTKYLEVWHE